MPIVTINLLTGRTIEQKRELVKQITEVLCRTINTVPEDVTIILNEMSKENHAKNGRLTIDKSVSK